LELQGAFEDQGFSMANLQWENPSGRSARKKGWKGSTLCSLCGDKETVDHIFIHYVLPKYVWGRLKNMAGWDRVPRSVASLFSNWGVGTSHAACTFHLFIVAGLVWSLWCNRNKMAIMKKIP
jgi:hypothetical protein